MPNRGVSGKRGEGGREEKKINKKKKIKKLSYSYGSVLRDGGE